MAVAFGLVGAASCACEGYQFPLLGRFARLLCAYAYLDFGQEAAKGLWSHITIGRVWGGHGRCMARQLLVADANV
jgi:hypothetical protein